MLRAILAVIVGYALWTCIWLGGNAFFLAKSSDAIQHGLPLTDSATLLGALALSIVCSLAAGAACGAIAAAKSRPAALILAILLLLTGIGVQVSIWKQEPIWYHLAFLILLVPVTLAGARLVKK